MKPYLFILSIDLKNETITATGGRARVITKDDRLEVLVGLGSQQVKIISLQGGILTVYPPAGGVLPLYYAKDASIIRISNFPHLLIRKGERITISGEVIANRLTGAGQQMYDPFISLQKFKDGHSYEVTDKKVRCTGSLISFQKDAHFDDVANFLLRRFKEYRELYDSVLIPLSGGYDSRLNLALARRFFRPDEINCLHEYKNEEEDRIAKSVAKISGIILKEATRSKDQLDTSHLSTNDEFILLSGLNRKNILRWTLELDRHRPENGNQAIIGFGAEAHKGKFYNQIMDVTSDSFAIFGCKASLLQEAASALGIAKPEPIHERYLVSSIDEAKSLFSSTASQIDYIHYRNYVAASYGYRCRYFSDAYQMDFPNLDAKFLSLVFSMPRAKKENFRLVRELMSQLSPELNDLDYVSGNIKSTKGRRSIVFDKVTKRVSWMIFGRPDKGRLDGIGLRSEKGNSEFTSTLRRLATTKSNLIRSNEAAVMFNYFSLLEDMYQVEFDLV